MKKIIRLTLTALTTFIITTNAHAGLLPFWTQHETWRPIFAPGFGLVGTSDLGNSQNFPIPAGTHGNFYNYSVYNRSTILGLVDGFFGVEWNVIKHWLLQTGVDYTQASDAFSVKGKLTQGTSLATAENYIYNYRITGRQLLLMGKLLSLHYDNYYPYVLVGLGAGINTAGNFLTTVPSQQINTRVYKFGTERSFSYALGIGVDMKWSDTSRWGINYRFADLGKAQLGTAFVNGVEMSGALTQTHFYMNELIIQYSWLG